MDIASGSAIADENGTITLTGVVVTNEALIQASNAGQVFFNSGSVTNDGQIVAITGGKITFGSSLSGVTNENGGVIEGGAGSSVVLDAVTVANTGGTIEAVGTNAAVGLQGTTIDGGHRRPPASAPSSMR